MIAVQLHDVTVRLSPEKDYALVLSSRRPRTWYTVAGGRCGCPGFRYHHKCKHLSTVTEARRLISEPQPELLVIPPADTPPQSLFQTTDKDRLMLRMSCLRAAAEVFAVSKAPSEIIIRMAEELERRALTRENAVPRTRENS